MKQVLGQAMAPQRTGPIASEGAAHSVGLVMTWSHQLGVSHWRREAAHPERAGMTARPGGLQRRAGMPRQLLLRVVSSA